MNHDDLIGNRYQKPRPPALALPSVGARPPGVFCQLTKPFLEQCSSWLTGKTVLEVFGGNGFLAAHLAARNVAIKSTSVLSGMDGHEKGLYYPVEDMLASTAVRQYGLTSDVLLMCWPTTTNDALAAALLWGPGRDILFIGEISDCSTGFLGGCATDAFFDSVTLVHEFDMCNGRTTERAVVFRLRDDN